MKNHVEEILNRALDIHLKKRSDYTTDPTNDPFENFRRSNEIARWLPTEYKSFGVLIGTKLARLGALLSSDREPKNESIDDTFLDLVTYCSLMYAFHKKHATEILEIAEKVAEQIELPVQSEYKGGLGDFQLTPATPEEMVQVKCTHTKLNIDRICTQCRSTVSAFQVKYDYHWDELTERHLKK